MTLKHEMVKSNMYSFSGRIITVVFSFFLSIYMARTLQPYEFGLYTLAFTIVVFASMFANFSLTTTMIRYVSNYFSAKKFGEVRATLSFITKWKMIFLVICALLIMIFNYQIAAYVFNKPEISYIVFLSGILLFANILFNFISCVLRAFRNFKVTSLNDCVQIILETLFIIIFITLGFKAAGAIVGLVLSFLVVSVYSYFYIRNKYKDVFLAKPKKINKKEMIDFSLWVLITDVTHVFDVTIDKMMIGMLLPVTAVGFYGIGWTWANAITTLVPVSQFVLFSFFSMDKHIDVIKKMLFEGMRYMIMLTVPVAFLLSAFSESFILILYQTSYIEAVSILSILSFASIPLVLNGLLHTFFQSINKPKIGAKILTGMIVLNLVFNYIAITTVGMIGVAIVSLILAVVQLFIFLWIAHFRENVKIDVIPLVKPFIAITPVYWLAIQLPSTTSIFTLILYGILGIGIYTLTMFLVKGIKKHYIELMRSSLKRTSPLK